MKITTKSIRNPRKSIEQPTKATRQKKVNQTEAKQSPRGPPKRNVKISVFIGGFYYVSRLCSPWFRAKLNL
jgi:hypothetical protein